MRRYTLANYMSEKFPINAKMTPAPVADDAVGVPTRFLAEQAQHNAQQQMVKDSMTRAFDELHSSHVKHDARMLFKK